MALTNPHKYPGSAFALRSDASRRYLLVALLPPAAALALLLLASPDYGASVVQENGPVETLSELFFFATALVLLPAGVRVWPFTVVAFACGLRELDLDKSLFSEGLLKSRQFIGDTVSLGERLVALAVLTALLTAGVLAVRRGLHNARSRIRNGDGVFLCVILGLILIAVAKLLDGLSRKLAPLGLEVSNAVSHQAFVFEEVAELGAAMCFLCGAIAFMRGLNASRSVDGATS